MSSTCARMRRAIVVRDLGALSTERAEELKRHLAACPSCASHDEDEARLTLRLAAVASAAPPSIDVRARVLREIARRQPAADRPPLGWAAGIAALATLGLAAWFVLAWPTMLAGVSQTGSALEACGAVVSALAAALAPLVTRLVDAGETVAKVIASFAPLVRAAVPIVTTLLVVATLTAAATIAVAVGRDVVGAPRFAGPEES